MAHVSGALGSKNPSLLVYERAATLEGLPPRIIHGDGQSYPVVGASGEVLGAPQHWSLEDQQSWAQQQHLQRLGEGDAGSNGTHRVIDIVKTPHGDLPVRPGAKDCVHYLRTGTCGFGSSCKFHHPPDRKGALAAVSEGDHVHPERPSEPDCQFFLRTGSCRFGATCKFNHPPHLAGTAKDGLVGDAGGGGLALNSLQLPMRPGMQPCAYYLRTGSCKYGASCRYDHPEGVVPTQLQVGQAGAGSGSSASSSPPNAAAESNGHGYASSDGGASGING
eukprot:CAMPEP_0182866676 /NCGR_PEP_ID=MMETSP0034_2-20130328/8326_1 /TAXON_ID=156128 /ORGANISM="Nephroselmis pyriformis, Strain CCMP717" /LENGTH=276 /DNA_ID=CAMNT_0024999005 /DNA_START=143 /DNA_END=970 /DNA_ORIENTATION=+